MKFENRNILPENLKQSFRNPIVALIIGSVAISLNFGFPSTWSAIVTTLLFTTLVLWIGDRIFNAWVRGVDVKGIYVALPAAVILMIIAWIFSYLAVLYPTYELVFMGIWFILAIVFLKFIFFGEEDYQRKAWTQALLFAVVIGIVTVIAMWVAAYVTIGFEYMGMSQYYAAIATSVLFGLIVLALMWLDRKNIGELGETIREAGHDVATPEKWTGKGW